MSTSVSLTEQRGNNRDRFILTVEIINKRLKSVWFKRAENIAYDDELIKMLGLMVN